MTDFISFSTAFLSGFNVLDVTVVLIITICTYRGYTRGFMQTLFSLVSLFLSLFLVQILYPILSRFLRTTPLFNKLKDSIIDSMGISYSFQNTNQLQQAEIINSLPLPDTITTILNNNNNTHIYNLLNVTSIEEYIGVFFATAIINIMSFIILFIVISVILKLSPFSISIFTKLPIIRSFNKLFGGIIGFIQSVFIIWVGLIIYTILSVKPGNYGMTLLYNSNLALYFYERNFLLSLLFSIFE